MKKTIIGLGIMALVLGLFAITSEVADAYRGDPKVQGPNYSTERHEAMTQAFAKGDYNAWKSLVPAQSRVARVINEGNFAKFVEAHNLALQGRFEEANKIRTELGLQLGNGSGQGRGFGRGMGMGLHR